MFKLYLFRSTQKLAASISGKPRQVFKKGDKVIVAEEDKIRLLRFGFKLIGEKILTPKDIEWEEIGPKTPREPTNEELKNILTEANVSFPKNANKETLLKLIEDLKNPTPPNETNTKDCKEGEENTNPSEEGDTSTQENKNPEASKDEQEVKANTQTS